MIFDIFFLIVGLAGAAGLYYCWQILNSADEGPENVSAADGSAAQQGPPMSEGQHITYQAISRLWAIDRVQRIKFQDMARNWRDIPKTEEQAPKTIEFRHAELMKFYQEQVKTRPFFVGQTLDAALALLGLLDAHGDCPSVVNLHKDEPEKSMDINSYAALAKIPLYLHSIHVAEEAIRKVSEGALIPKAVIAALAHDLGKIPAFYDRFYESATHAFAGVVAMETLPSVKNLKDFGEIEAAVRNHHQQSDGYLDKIVRNSDHIARRGEISSFAAEALTQDQSKSKASVLPEQEKDQSKPGAIDTSGNRAESKDIFGVGTEVRKRVARELVDISAWFEPERFVRDLLKIVNTKQQTEKFWSALELDGYVYVKQPPFWHVITLHANKNAEVTAAALSEQHRDNIIYSVVMKLQERENTIATEFIGEGFHGAVFIHNPKASSEIPTEVFLIPFRAAAFGADINNTIHKKTAQMLCTVALNPKLKIGKRG